MDGHPMKFDHAGMFGGNYTIADRETGTRWQQETGEATEGKLKGRHLEIYPFVITSWKAWRQRYPETLVMLPVPGLAEQYAEFWGRIVSRNTTTPGRPAPNPGQTLHPEDARLSAYSLVIGAEVGGARRAYPLDVLKKEGVINDQLGNGEPVLVVYTPDDDTVTMFSRALDARTLTFDRHPQSSELVDVETGSRWNEYGECVAGKLRGSHLKALMGEPQYWWGWAAYGGPTSVYGGRGMAPR